jgi:hypothetical protein
MSLNSDCSNRPVRRPVTFFFFQPKRPRIERSTPVEEEIQGKDLETLVQNFGNGGTIVSVHSPFQAEAWLDKHKHKPVIKAIHSAANARGPVAAMIHPRLPGLSIFGSVDDPDHHAHAKRLADVSGFVVILRPLADYPLEIPAQSNTSFDSIEGLPSTYGDLAEGASSKIGKALRLRGGASSSSDDESDDGVYLRSHVHSSTIRATLVDDDCHHPIRITSAYSVCG